MADIIDIEAWLNDAKERLLNQFGQNLLFLGLQGSYNRGEATAQSDIDLVVILENLDFSDLRAYRGIICKMPHNDKACGFISGKNELLNWSKSDLFQFFYETRPILGDLSKIISPPSSDDIKTAFKTGAETVYHAAVHSFLHAAEPAADLRSIYKMLFFVLQVKFFIEHGRYISSKNELLGLLNGPDKEILLDSVAEIPQKTPDEIDCLYEKVIKWASENITGAHRL